MTAAARLNPVFRPIATQTPKFRPAGCAGGAAGKEFVTLLVIL